MYLKYKYMGQLSEILVALNVIHRLAALLSVRKYYKTHL